MAVGRQDQGGGDRAVSTEASGARPDPEARRGGSAGLVQRVMAVRVVRVLLHYAADNGPLIAGGLTYQAIFAVFAGLWFGFSVAGFVLRGNVELQDAVFRTLNGFIPGLVAVDGGRGAIRASVLLDASSLTWAGAISLVGVLFTAVGFLGTLRTGVRIMFALPNLQSNPVVQKLKDTGLTLAFGAVVLFTAALSLLSNAALDLVLGLAGLQGASALEQAGASAITFLVLFVVDALLVVGALRILSGIPIPRRRLLVGGAIGGLGLATVETLGSALLGGATSNPVVQTFATVIGLLLYCNLVNQVVLIAASWVAVGMQDAGIDARSLSPEEKEQEQAERIEDARRTVADADREALEQRVRDARGLRRWRLVRELEREVRAEARRRQGVPTTSEFAAAQRSTDDADPDAEQVAEADREAPAGRP